MSGPVDQALQSLGVDVPATDPVSGLSDAITTFNAQNLTPQDIYRGVQEFPRTVGGAIPDIGARVPELGRIPIPFPRVGGVVGRAINAIPTVFFGTDGEWQSPRYAYDLNRHHPKLKFLFKVGFEGFGVRDFYYFVQRVEKPRVRFLHQDVNFYNFRTRVLTNTVFEPLSITFLDEIGNSVNDFFVNYMTIHSGQGSGGVGIDQGFGPASSSFNYKNGYSTGTRVTVEQVFANGTSSNRYMFINPRIETFDFDDLNMEESAGSMLTVTFSYDGLEMETVQNSTIYSWGDTDLLRGGGTSGESNGGDTNGAGSGAGGTFSANGSGIGGGGSSITKQVDIAYEAIQNGMNVISQIPGAIADMVDQGVTAIRGYTQDNVVGSSSDTVSSNIQGTLSSIASGDNLKFGEDTPDVETYSVDLSTTTISERFP